MRNCSSPGKKTALPNSWPGNPSIDARDSRKLTVMNSEGNPGPDMTISIPTYTSAAERSRGLRPDGTWQAVAEPLGWVRHSPGLATGNSQRRPGRHRNIQNVIDTCLPGRHSQVFRQDDACPGQQLPAPGHARPRRLAHIQGHT